MLMHLTKEGLEPTAEERAARDTKRVSNGNIVIHRDFTGVVLSPAEFQEFQKIVNERRPYCSKDFVPQTFIPDLNKYFEKNR